MDNPYSIKMAIVKAYLEHLDKEAIYVVPFGYNQFSREFINKKYQKDLKGNAEIYYVGKLKDMIGKTRDFMEN